jgi:hypothetical protein
MSLGKIFPISQVNPHLVDLCPAVGEPLKRVTWGNKVYYLSRYTSTLMYVKRLKSSK